MIKIGKQIIGDKTFPNNEVIIDKVNDCVNMHLSLNAFDEINVFMRYDSDSDIVKLIFIKKHLDDNFTGLRVRLSMPYIPYSRMDRKINGFCFTLKYFCDIINSLNFDSVSVLDSHSNVSTALLNNCVEFKPLPYIEKAINFIKSKNQKIDYIFYPDNGAYKRYVDMSQDFDSSIYDIPSFFGNKLRNLQTGDIIDYQLINSPNLKGKNVLIIDDLCSKGFTFYNAGLKLKESGVDNLYLYVTHCEESIYRGKLLSSNLFNKIFTTNSILTNWESDVLYKVLDVLK